MTANRIPRFLIRYQVWELKKSWKDEAITTAVCRLSTRPQTQAPRTRRAGRARTRRRSGGRRCGPSLEVREKVQGAGHDDRASELVRAGERRRRIVHGLDVGEVAAGTRGELPRRQGALVRGLRRHEPRRKRRE